LGYQIFKGHPKTDDFGFFMSNLINNVECIKNNLNNTIFYMDNNPIHHAEKLKPFFDCINVFYAAPFSPFCNPIEEFFSVMKRKIR
jgi:hypothetical protein